MLSMILFIYIIRVTGEINVEKKLKVYKRVFHI